MFELVRLAKFIVGLINHCYFFAVVLMLQNSYYISRHRQNAILRRRQSFKSRVAAGLEEAPMESLDATQEWTRHFNSQSFYARHVIPEWDHQASLATNAQQRREIQNTIRGLRHNQMQIRALRHLPYLRLPQIHHQVRLRPPLAPFHIQHELLAVQRGFLTPPNPDRVQRELLARTLLEPANLPFPTLARGDFTAVLLSEDFPDVPPGAKGPYDPYVPDTYAHCPLALADADRLVTVQDVLDTGAVREPHAADPVRRFPYNRPYFNHPNPPPDEQRRLVCLLCEADSMEITSANLGASKFDTPEEPEPLLNAVMTKTQMCFHLGECHEYSVKGTIYSSRIRKRIRTRRLSAPDAQPAAGEQVVLAAPSTRRINALANDQKSTCYRYYPEWIDPAQARSLLSDTSGPFTGFAAQPRIEVRNSPNMMVPGPLPPLRVTYAKIKYFSPISFAYIHKCQMDPTFQHGYDRRLPFNRTRLYQAKFPELHELDVLNNLRDSLAASLPHPGQSSIVMPRQSHLPQPPNIRRFADLTTLPNQDTDLRAPAAEHVVDEAQQERPPARTIQWAQPIPVAEFRAAAASRTTEVVRVTMEAQQEYADLSNVGINDTYQATHVKQIPRIVSQKLARAEEPVPADAAYLAIWDARDTTVREAATSSTAQSSSAKESFGTPQESMETPFPTRAPSDASSEEDWPPHAAMAFNRGFMESDDDSEDGWGDATLGSAAATSPPATRQQSFFGSPHRPDSQTRQEMDAAPQQHDPALFKQDEDTLIHDQVAQQIMSPQEVLAQQHSPARGLNLDLFGGLHIAEEVVSSEVTSSSRQDHPIFSSSLEAVPTGSAAVGAVPQGAQAGRTPPRQTAMAPSVRNEGPGSFFAAVKQGSQITAASLLSTALAPGRRPRSRHPASPSVPQPQDGPVPLEEAGRQQQQHDIRGLPDQPTRQSARNTRKGHWSKSTHVFHPEQPPSL